MIDRLKPIAVASFASHVLGMHHDRDKGFELEYQVKLHNAVMQVTIICEYLFL